MAAAEERQADSLALDIPSILIGSTGNTWLTTYLSEGVVLSLGGDRSRCSGGRLLTAESAAADGMKVAFARGVRYESSS